MKKKIISLISIMALFLGLMPINLNLVYAASLSFTTLKEVDKGSFNEYGYKITKAFSELEEVFMVDYVLDSKVLNKLLLLIEDAKKYLPDDLNNESKYNLAKIALKKGLKYPNNDEYFENIRKTLEDFIENKKIQSLKGNIIVTPNEGNAPLITTIRANIEDPSGSQISHNAYVWWMYVNGKRKVIGNKPSISHTFLEKGTFKIFLDVKTSHRNSYGNRDVLPFSGSVNVVVKEKIASLILRISGKSLDFDDTIKFSPETAGYGLIFDATSSSASPGSKFIKTTWDFGNGVKKSYLGGPRIERIIYSREGDYDVVLKIETNQGDIIEKKFRVLVHKPIASISVNSTTGFIGDNFVFKAKSYGKNQFLTYSWQIIDTQKDKVLVKKVGSVFTYSFKEKGDYSVALQIKDSAGNVDVDNENIVINSRPPVANFKTTIPFSNKPNKVFFDATSSYDPDFSDDGNLKYFWTIDGQKVFLEDSNEDGSNGFYTFETIGDHSVVLEVEDLDEIVSIKRGSVKVESLLDVDFSIYPRVVQREQTVRFIAESKRARFYEWDFGDGETKSKESSKIAHTYNKSGIFQVKLTVRGENRTKNTYVKNVYVGDSKNPVSVIDIKRQGSFDFIKEQNACGGKEAFIISRKDKIVFSGKDSIDTNGLNKGLLYSWVVGKGKYKTGQSINERFDELGCFRIKLTVKSERDKTTDSSEIWVKVKNMLPVISGLKVVPVDLKTDPVIVNVSALGTKDPDGVIQSYIWYYSTDTDNNPQDFRITKKPETTFVIPKIQGTYYFGVTMKDNNGAKLNSEDLVNKIGNNFIELQGDNSNTPLIDFTSSDYSVSIGEEVSFKAEAKNIRGDSIEKTAEFSWDFDGDGFYDKKTKKGIVRHVYKTSGTFYPKVKVKNKGFSNTRTLKIDVSNKLTSDFKYISVGNKYIFVDTSKGIIDRNSWDLGDGTKEEDKEKIIHKYDDKKPSHFVELTVAEGKKVKKTKKEVEKDLRNLLKSRKKGLNVFTFPALNKNGEIELDEEENVFVYMGESKGDFKFYGIDYDINKDSDINGGKDDDIENKNNSSYKTGAPDKIILNENKNQIIRLFLLDKDGSIVESKDIHIIKKYINEEEKVSIGEFIGVTEEEKVKIEKLKISISKLPQQNRIKAMQFVQKMQENWNDNTEKVRTIIAFEEFIDSIGYENKEQFNNLLESFITEDTSDEKVVFFEALKALIPENIECSVEKGTCKEFLEKKLEEIKNSSDVNVNKELGKEILAPILKSKEMTVKQKEDFKGILSQLAYGTYDPPVEAPGKNDPSTSGTGTTVKGESIEGSDLLGFLKNAGWWIAGIVGFIIFIMFIFWILDFLKNRKNGESFEEFVDNKTSDEEMDLLADFSDPLNEKKEEENIDPLQNSTENKPSAMFSQSEKKIEIKEKVSEEKNKKIKKEELKIENTKEAIPDWLSGNVDEQKKDEEKEKKIDEEGIKEEENFGFSLDIPEEEKSNDFIEEIKEPKKVEKVKKVESKNNKKELTQEDNFDIEKEINIEEDNTPDWLKDSLTEKIPKKKIIQEEEKQEEDIKEEEERQEEPIVVEDKKEEELKLDSEEDIPDWLKGSLEESKKEKKENKENKKNNEEKPKGKENKKGENKKEKKGENKEEELKLDSEEDIPDWLKGSLEESKKEKKENKENKKNNEEKPKGKENKKLEDKEDKKEEEIKLDEEDIPDWLKGSLEESKKENKENKDNKENNEEKPKGKENKKGENKKEKKGENKEDELWEDGMTIPDWLKTD